MLNITAVGDEEQGDGQLRNTSHHLHSAHSLFPSQLCSAVIQIVNMLDDAAVAGDGNAVYEVAYQVCPSSIIPSIHLRSGSCNFVIYSTGDMELFSGRQCTVFTLCS